MVYQLSWVIWIYSLPPINQTLEFKVQASEISFITKFLKINKDKNIYKEGRVDGIIKYIYYLKKLKLT